MLFLVPESQMHVCVCVHVWSVNLSSSASDTILYTAELFLGLGNESDFLRKPAFGSKAGAKAGPGNKN